MSKELNLVEREHLGRDLHGLTMYTYEARQKAFNKICKAHGRAFIERLLADVFHNSPNWGATGKQRAPGRRPTEAALAAILKAWCSTFPII